VTPTALDLSVHPGGNVALAWFESRCTLRYGFDARDLASASAQPDHGSFALPGCDANFVSPGLSVAAGPTAIAVAVRVPTGFTTSDVRWITAAPSTAPGSTLLDRDQGESALSPPRIGTDTSGATVALWQTTDRGVWAAHAAEGATPTSPFLVEAHFFTLATRMVDKVYPRGDGRFMLAWTGGQQGVRNRLEFRDYSAAQGLSARQSMPYEVATATNMTALHASTRGISVVWSYASDLNRSLVTAVQAFLP
jgi:hypothetical protein